MIRAAAIVVVIAALAYGAGYLHGRGRTGETATPPATHEQTAARAPATALPAVFPVEVIGAGGRAVVTGIALGDHGRVALPLAALHEARAAFLATPGGRIPLGGVVGVLPASRLASLTGPPGTVAVSAEPASLRLGLPVTAVSPHASVAGAIESTAERRSDGTYAYAVRLEAPLDEPFAALLDAGGGVLVGAITGGGEDGTYTAVDAGALQDLATDSGDPAPIERFADEYFAQEPAGRLIAFEHAHARGDWTEAVALGRALIDLGWTWRDAVAEPLDVAWLEAARAARDDPQTALALLDEAAATLGESAPRLHERAELLAASGAPLAAIEAETEAARLDPSLRASLRERVVATAQSLLPIDRRTRVLERAIEDDQSYAPYHAELGRLYYEQGRYVDAAASLEQAIALGGGPADALQTMLASARQRLRTPGETIAPLHAGGGGLYVYAEVGGRQMRLVVDTGAAYTALSADAARTLGISGYTDRQRVMLATANGRVSAPLVTLNALAVNGAIVQNVPVVILDSMGPYDGLLGMSFLDHFDVSIDRRAGHIRLRRR